MASIFHVDSLFSLPEGLTNKYGIDPISLLLDNKQEVRMLQITPVTNPFIDDDVDEDGIIRNHIGDDRVIHSIHTAILHQKIDDESVTGTKLALREIISGVWDYGLDEKSRNTSRYHSEVMDMNRTYINKSMEVYADTTVWIDLDVINKYINLFAPPSKHEEKRPAMWGCPTCSWNHLREKQTYTVNLCGVIPSRQVVIESLTKHGREKCQCSRSRINMVNHLKEHFQGFRDVYTDRLEEQIEENKNTDPIFNTDITSMVNSTKCTEASATLRFDKCPCIQRASQIADETVMNLHQVQNMPKSIVLTIMDYVYPWNPLPRNVGFKYDFNHPIYSGEVHLIHPANQDQKVPGSKYQLAHEYAIAIIDFETAE